MKILRQVLRWILAGFFIVARAEPFPDTRDLLRHDAGLGSVAGGDQRVLVGLAEILGGAGLIFPATRRLAGWALLVLLVAVFPANVHVALQGRMPGTEFSPAILWWRLPFQALFIAWVWWVAVKRRPEDRLLAP